MTLWIGPDTAPQAWRLLVTEARPWHTPSVAVHRGLGGRTQTVWTATPADAGQRFTHRCSTGELEQLLALLAAPGRVRLSSDDPACALQLGAGVVTRIDPAYRYDLAPAAVDVSIEVVWT